MLIFNILILLSALNASNTLMKQQLFELLSAVCLYNNRGYQLALSSFDYSKVS